MTALTMNKQSSFELWTYRSFTLKSGTIAFVNALAALELATGKVVPGVEGPGYLPLGTFTEKVDASAGDKAVTVRFPSEKRVEWFANASGAGEVTATDIGKVVYVDDDATVTLIPTGRALGRAWSISAADGVAVEFFRDAPGEPLPVLEAPAFSSNESTLTGIVNGATYTVPTTGAASTVNLPADPDDGSHCWFAADGSANGHAVTYEDDGTAITAALTASKRHLVHFVAAGGVWHAQSTVSP